MPASTLLERSKVSAVAACVIICTLGGGMYAISKDFAAALEKRASAEQVEELTKKVDTKETIKRVDDIVKWDKESQAAAQKALDAAEARCSAQIAVLNAHFDKIDTKLDHVLERLPRKAGLEFFQEYPLIVRNP